MESGELSSNSVEPAFMPTLVGLAGPGVDAARSAGVLVEHTDLGDAIERLLGSSGQAAPLPGSARQA